MEVHRRFMRVSQIFTYKTSSRFPQISNFVLQVSERYFTNEQWGRLMLRYTLYILHIYTRYTSLLSCKYTFRWYFILSAPLLTVLRLFRFDDGRKVVKIDSTSITDDQTTSRNVFVGRLSCNGDLYTARLHFFFLARITRTLFRLLSLNRFLTGLSKGLPFSLYLSPTTVRVHLHPRYRLVEHTFAITLCHQ